MADDAGYSTEPVAKGNSAVAGESAMRTTTRIAALAIAAAATTGLTTFSAEALPRCRAPVEGFATATGILGAGSAKAREEARIRWRRTARNLYGPRYADFRNAQDRQWDCKKNAILLAKCVVVARPCRY